LCNDQSQTSETLKSGKNNSYLRKLLTDTGLFALSSFGSRFLVFFLAPLYTYVLSTEQFGTVDLLQTTVIFLYPLLTLSISEAVLRFAMDEDSDPRQVLSIGLLFVVASSVLLVCLYPVGIRILPELQPYWGAFVGYYFLYNLQDCYGNYVKAIGKTKVFAVTGLLHTCILLLCSIAFLLGFRWGLNGYIASLLISTACSVVYLIVAGGLYKVGVHLPLECRLIKNMLLYSLPLIPSLISWSVNTNISKYMIISLYGIGASGIYAIANKIPIVMTMVLNVFLQAWQLNAISIRNTEGEEIYYNKVYSATKTICLVMCLLLIPFSQLLTKLLFAPAYHEAWRYVPMLIIAAMYSALSGFIAAPFRAYKNSMGLFSSVAIGAIVNILLNAFLLSVWNVEGAAVATALSFIIVWFIRINTVQKHVKIHRHVKDVAVCIILLAMSTILMLEIKYAYVVYVAGSVACLILVWKDVLQLADTCNKLLRKMLDRTHRDVA
jgi:O-antigen/teichoic acid export membrane protein